MDFFVIVHSDGSYFGGFTSRLGDDNPSDLIPHWVDLTAPACIGHVCVFCSKEYAEISLKEIGYGAQIKPVPLPQFDHG